MGMGTDGRGDAGTWLRGGGDGEHGCRAVGHGEGTRGTWAGARAPRALGATGPRLRGGRRRVPQRRAPHPPGRRRRRPNPGCCGVTRGSVTTSALSPRSRRLCALGHPAPCFPICLGSRPRCPHVPYSQSHVPVSPCPHMPKSPISPVSPSPQCPISPSPQPHMSPKPCPQCPISPCPHSHIPVSQCPMSPHPRPHIPAVPTPVALRPKHRQHRGPSVQSVGRGDGLEDIEVEGDVPGHGALQPLLQERRPAPLQDPRGAAGVITAHAAHARHRHLRREQRPQRRGWELHSLPWEQRPRRWGWEQRHGKGPGSGSGSGLGSGPELWGQLQCLDWGRGCSRGATVMDAPPSPAAPAPPPSPGRRNRRVLRGASRGRSAALGTARPSAPLRPSTRSAHSPMSPRTPQPAGAVLDAAQRRAAHAAIDDGIARLEVRHGSRVQTVVCGVSTRGW